MNRHTAKVTVSLPAEMVSFADRYRATHQLSTRSEVLKLALTLLREKELEEGYRALARHYDSDPDPLLDSGLNETLEGIDKG